MTLNELQDGQIVTARWGRAGREDVQWNDWQKVPLYIQRHKGQVVILALAGKNWAEYSPKHSFDGTTFLTEDYYLQIKGLV